jgi:hypothetical protein
VRAAIAFLVASLLMWTQAMAAMSPVVHVESAACCCCDCGKRDCCEAPAPSNPQPPLTAAVRIAAQDQAKLPKPVVIESRTVLVSPVRKYFLPPVVQRVRALPLFQRHCALLI